MLSEPEQDTSSESRERYSCTVEWTEIVPWEFPKPPPPPEPPPEDAYPQNYPQPLPPPEPPPAIWNEAVEPHDEKAGQWNELVNEFVMSHDPSEVVRVHKYLDKFHTLFSGASSRKYTRERRKITQKCNYDSSSSDSDGDKPPPLAQGYESDSSDDESVEPVRRSHSSTQYSHVYQLRTRQHQPKSRLRVLLHSVLSPKCFHGTSSAIPLIVDSGASVCISPRREDFITYRSSKVKIKDLSSTHAVEGEGLMRWRVRDKHGQVVILELPGYYIPSADVRLLSPQVMLSTLGGQAVQTPTDLSIHLDSGIELVARYCA